MGRKDREKQRKAKARREKNLKKARARAKEASAESRGPGFDEHKAFAEKAVGRGQAAGPAPPRQSKTG